MYSLLNFTVYEQDTTELAAGFEFSTSTKDCNTEPAELHTRTHMCNNTTHGQYVKDDDKNSM
jgi:hypothetical protein